MKQELTVSDITRSEVLGYHRLDEKDEIDLGELFERTEVYPVSPAMVDLAIGWG